ncbi:MAG: DUF1573 domain-containing protein [Ignavibacteriaceae bacterium]|jgi:hypothetical protein
MIKNIVFSIIVLSALSYAQLLQPKIVLQQNSFDFGTIKQGEVATHDFVISNSGGDLLKISNVSASCGCTAAAPEKKELAPGESTNLKVSFNSAGRQGRQNKTIRIYSNDPQNPELVLSFTGSVILPDAITNNPPVIYLPETEHDFGQVNEGDTVKYTFRFVNKGGSTLTIKDIKTSCGCTAALLSDDNLLPNKEGTVKVELNTSHRSGKMSRTVTIHSNDPKDPAKIITIYADVVRHGS